MGGDLQAVPLSATLSKTVAGWLGILLGSYGVHKFYMGDYVNGLIRLAVSLVTCGTGFVVTFPLSVYEGIHYLTMDARQFYWEYDTRDCLYGRTEPKHWL